MSSQSPVHLCRFSILAAHVTLLVWNVDADRRRRPCRFGVAQTLEPGCLWKLLWDLYVYGKSRKAHWSTWRRTVLFRTTAEGSVHVVMPGLLGTLNPLCMLQRQDWLLQKQGICEVLLSQCTYNANIRRPFQSVEHVRPSGEKSFKSLYNTLLTFSERRMCVDVHVNVCQSQLQQSCRDVDNQAPILQAFYRAHSFFLITVNSPGQAALQTSQGQVVSGTM